MKDFLNKNIGSLIGTAIAIFLGVMLLVIGFWKTMLLILLGVIGFLLGNVRIRSAVVETFRRIFDSEEQ